MEKFIFCAVKFTLFFFSLANKNSFKTIKKMYCIYSKLKKRICTEHIRSAKDNATKPSMSKKS